MLTSIAMNNGGSGASIKQRLEKRCQIEVTLGRLYPNLDILVERRLIDKGEIDCRTNSYRGLDEESVRPAWRNGEYERWACYRLSHDIVDLYSMADISYRDGYSNVGFGPIP